MSKVWFHFVFSWAKVRTETRKNSNINWPADSIPVSGNLYGRVAQLGLKAFCSSLHLKWTSTVVVIFSIANLQKTTHFHLYGGVNIYPNKNIFQALFNNLVWHGGGVGDIATVHIDVELENVIEGLSCSLLVLLLILMFLEVVRYPVKASETWNAKTLDDDTHSELDNNKEDQWQ